MKRRRGGIDIAIAVALAGAIGVTGACGRSEKPAAPKGSASAPGPAGTAAGPPGSLGREIREGEAKVGDVVRESTGAGAAEVERGKRLPGPTPTFPPGQRKRPRY